MWYIKEKKRKEKKDKLSRWVSEVKNTTISVRNGVDQPAIESPEPNECLMVLRGISSIHHWRIYQLIETDKDRRSEKQKLDKQVCCHRAPKNPRLGEGEGGGGREIGLWRNRSRNRHSEVERGTLIYKKSTTETYLLYSKRISTSYKYNSENKDIWKMREKCRPLK